MTRRILHRLPRMSFAAAIALVLASSGTAESSLADAGDPPVPHDAPPGSLTVLTYNVHGLPWPVALDREPAFERIGERLAQMRRSGIQPDVVVLQEAFVEEAKAIGAEAGYRYRALGPAAAAAARGRADPRVPRAWYLGETQGKVLDSGLVILSDLPLSRVRRMAFSDSDCAGFDCLAAKGAVLVDVALPGGGTASIVTTHFNSGRASRAGRAASDAAYVRQARRLGQFLRGARRADVPLLIAGDFNRGNRPARVAPLGPALAAASDGGEPVDALAACVTVDGCAAPRTGEIAAIGKRADDFQFVLQGKRAGLVPVTASVPFPLAEGLSDHAGFTVSYRLLPTARR